MILFSTNKDHYMKQVPGDTFNEEKFVSAFNMKDMDAETIEQFEELSNEEYEETYKPIIELEDYFGSDFISVNTKSGHIILTDRNCGFHQISTNPIDVQTILDYFS